MSGENSRHGQSRLWPLTGVLSASMYNTYLYLSAVNIRDYLNRIQYNGNTQPDPEFLARLQQAHLMQVPFENLDIHLGEWIDLKRAYAKVVHRHRGGFCYELNSLFCELLLHLGFDAQLISARVYHPPTQTFGPEYDHMAIAVHFDDGPFLADVGFGEFSFSPIPILPGHQHEDARGVFTIHYLDPDRFLVKKKDGDDEIPQYHFSLSPQKPEDFFEMCAWHQTSPESHFKQKRLCSMPTLDGRITLTGDVLKIKEGDDTKEITIASDEAFHQLLETCFGIIL